MVTGTNGYLGSHIVKDLLLSGHMVHACVRDATRKERVEHLLDLLLIVDDDNRGMMMREDCKYSSIESARTTLFYRL